MTSARIVSVIGARPQFIKAAVVSRALARRGVQEWIVHTGQHYDDAMSGRFLAELGIEVAANLDVGSGGHTDQTARMMTGFQSYLDTLATPPDAVVVYGDTNSTIAAGLVVSKVGIPLVHIEAGLRSYNRAMPEEVNRVVVDHLSELLFCSSPVGIKNLAVEGITDRVFDVGDVMLDAFQHFSQHTGDRPLAREMMARTGQPFALATVHRPSNTDNPVMLRAILEQLAGLSMPVLWPVHPRNRKTLAALAVPDTVHCVDPVGYLDMLALLHECSAVITDSGGLQKEAHWAKRPCITLRRETEWVETLEGGWNVLADPERDDLATLLSRTPSAPWTMLYGDGGASDRIAEHLESFIGSP